MSRSSRADAEANLRGFLVGLNLSTFGVITTENSRQRVESLVKDVFDRAKRKGVLERIRALVKTKELALSLRPPWSTLVALYQAQVTALRQTVEVKSAELECLRDEHYEGTWRLRQRRPPKGSPEAALTRHFERERQARKKWRKKRRHLQVLRESREGLGLMPVNWFQEMTVADYTENTGMERTAIQDLLRRVQAKGRPRKGTRGAPATAYGFGTNLKVLSHWLLQWVKDEVRHDTIYRVLWSCIPKDHDWSQGRRLQRVLREAWKTCRESGEPSVDPSLERITSDGRTGWEYAREFDRQMREKQPPTAVEMLEQRIQALDAEV